MRSVGILLSIALIAGCDGIGGLTDLEYVAKAEESLDSGNLPAAIISLKNALRENPDNTQARWLLGNVYLDTGNGPSAEKELTSARELGVADESVIPLLARSLIQQRKYHEVLKLDPGPGFSSEATAELLATRGLAYLLSGDSENAGRELDSAIRANPDSINALVELARLSVHLRDFDKARLYLDKAFETDPDYSLAWSLQGDLYRLENMPEAAIEAYTKAIENSHNKSRDLIQRARLYMQLAQYEQAQHDVDNLKKITPGHPEADFVQGLLYLAQNNSLEAQESLEHCLRKSPDHMLATYYLGVVHFTRGNMEQADRYLSSHMDDNPGSINGRKLLALVKLRLGDYISTENLIDPVVKSRPDDTIALNILADSMFYQGKIDELMPVLKESAAHQPDSASAQTRMGIGLLLQGEEEAAIDSLESAIEIDPGHKTSDMLLVLHYLHTQQYDKAQQAADAFTEKQPDNPIAHNLVGKSYFVQGQEAQATEAFEKARRLDPGNIYTCRNLAILALRQSDTERARALFHEALEHNEGHLTTMSLLAALEEREGNYKAMKTVLHQAIELHPNAITPRVLLAAQYRSEGDAEKALELLNEEIRARHRNNPVVLHVLGQAQLDARDYKDAKSTLSQLTKLQPDSPQAHFLLSKAYGGLNDSKHRKTELHKTLELAPNHLPANIALTRLWLREGNLAKAQQQLVSLKKQAPNVIEVMALEGDIYTLTDEPEKALTVYEAMYAARPNTANLLRLTQLQWQMGDREASVSRLESRVSEYPGDVAARQSLANAYVKLDRRDDAIAQYEEILKISGNNPIVLNDMAWHLRETDPERALQLAEKASSIAPHSVSVMDTQAAILIELGNTKQAERVINKALEIRPESPTLLFRRAVLLDAKGNANDAIVELTQLLEAHQEFPERREAENMLSRLQNTQG